MSEETDLFSTADMEVNRYRGYSTINNGYSQVIGKEFDEEWVIYGCEPVRWMSVLSRCISIFTMGLWALLLYWRPDWKVYFTYRKCSLQVASHVLILNGHGQRFLTRIENNYAALELSTEESCLRYFEHNFMKFVWSPQNMSFQVLRGLESGITCADFYTKLQGLDESQHDQKLAYFGPNIMDIVVKSYGRLFIDEVLNPFYFFQIASIILWCLDNYYYYGSCILFISLISIGISLYETKKQLLALKAMITQSGPQEVKVQRLGGEVQDVSACDLVPGDILVIPTTGCMMSCDAVLTAGNCIVNESMLTGESVPETKTPIMNSVDLFDIQKDKKHVLFSGTQVIQTRYYGHSSVTATVIRTGFSTAKGELVRSILFPKPMGFQFYRDSMRFVLILLCLAACGTIYSFYLYAIRHAPVGEMIKKALDVVTIVVPPALPAALTVGTVYSQSRLIT